MQHYFVLIELPGGSELKFTEANKSPDHFWHNAVNAIRKGRANLICHRQDTGLSEELRSYVRTTNRFTTFVLADLQMKRNECCNKKAILEKTAEAIKHLRHEMVIDTCNDFQLVTCDH